MAKPIDITGQRFGKLVAIAPVRRTKTGSIGWLLQCDCGRQTTALVGELRRGQRKACRCSRSKPIHGMSGTRLHSIWCGMKARCLNPKRYGFMYYGGKGIRVCDDWLKFIPFRDWALENGYAPDLQIDRVDPDGNYCPENCRWVSAQENKANVRHRNAVGLRYTLNEIIFAVGRAGIDPALLVEHLPNKRRYRNAEDTGRIASDQLDELRRFQQGAPNRNDPACRVQQPHP